MSHDVRRVSRCPDRAITIMNTTKTTRHFYAVAYINGVAVCAATGNRYLAHYHAFDSKDDRDAWTEGGGDFRTSRDWREPVSASDSEVRCCLRDSVNGDPYKDDVIYH
jgi:hypothetical protein